MKRLVKAVGALGLVGCAVVNPQFAMAADSGWLAGLNIGKSQAHVDNERIIADLQASGFGVSSYYDDASDTAFKIFGGYKFNPHFAVEGGYFYLGRFGYTANTVPAGTQTGTIKLQGLNVDAVGMLPFNEKWTGIGRLGLNYAQAKDGFASSGVVAQPADSSPSKNDLNYKLGLGMQYAFNEKVAMRGEWERYRINDAVENKGDVNMYSLGLVVMFGGNKAPAPKAAPAPVVVAPVRSQRQYCSVLDLTFEINADKIEREDLEKLGVVATFMKKYPDTTAVIEGHTDNVGSNADNMKLSQERADSVVNYLVDKQKIDASRLKAIGYGETRPIADNRTNAGKQENRRISAIIECATDFEGLKVTAARLTMALEIEFDPYKNDVKPEYRDELRKVANFMKANPTVTATVEGHADNVAGLGAKQTHPTAAVSMEVSRKRAQSVVDYLVGMGVERSRLTAAPFGMTRRASYGKTLAGQQENRRVNIIYKYKK